MISREYTEDEFFNSYLIALYTYLSDGGMIPSAETYLPRCSVKKGKPAGKPALEVLLQASTSLIDAITRYAAILLVAGEHALGNRGLAAVCNHLYQRNVTDARDGLARKCIGPVATSGPPVIRFSNMIDQAIMRDAFLLSGQLDTFSHGSDNSRHDKVESKPLIVYTDIVSPLGLAGLIRGTAVDPEIRNMSLDYLVFIVTRLLLTTYGGSLEKAVKTLMKKKGVPVRHLIIEIPTQGIMKHYYHRPYSIEAPWNEILWLVDENKLIDQAFKHCKEVLSQSASEMSVHELAILTIRECFQKVNSLLWELADADKEPETLATLGLTPVATSLGGSVLAPQFLFSQYSGLLDAVGLREGLREMSPRKTDRYMEAMGFLPLHSLVISFILLVEPDENGRYPPPRKVYDVFLESLAEVLRAGL